MCTGVIQIMNMEKEQAKMASKKQINKTKAYILYIILLI